MWRRLVDLASTAKLPGVCGIAGTRDQLEPRNRQDAWQGFAAKTQCRDPFEIIDAADLAGRVPCQRQCQLLRCNALAVVPNADQCRPALLDPDLDPPTRKSLG